MTASKSPSIWRIIQVDYISLLSVLFPLLFWGLYVWFDVLPILASAEGGRDASFLTVAAVTTAVGLLVFAARLYAIFTVYWNGIEVPGRIENVWFYRDRGRVEYTYTYLGKIYKRGTAIHRIRRTRELEIDQAVTLLVDRGNPRRALIRDLYL